jgi:hypothetical protein
LNAAQKTAARRAFALFLENPGHNSLQFKKLRGYPDYWSVRVSRDIRAVGKRTGDTIEWAWIGTHNEWSQRGAVRHGRAARTGEHSGDGESIRQTLRMNTALFRNPKSAINKSALNSSHCSPIRRTASTLNSQLTVTP